MVKKNKAKTSEPKEVKKEEVKTEDVVEESITSEQVEKVVEKLQKPKEDGVVRFDVHTGSGFIKMQPYRTAIPMYKLPKELQDYLLSKGFGSNVWEKDQKWLDEHKADPEMIEKLKKFISENYF